MSIRYVDLSVFDDPAAVAIVLAPEIGARAEKAAKRKAQQRGFAERKPRPSTGNPVGRPRLTEDEQTEAKAKHRAAQAAWISAKRAKLKESTENSGGRPEATGP